VQSAFISPEESLKVVNFIKANNEAYYDEEATAYINNTKSSSSSSGAVGGGEKEIEPVYIEALKYVILSGSASISMIQRKTSAGYNRAGKIVEWMEDMGYISPFEGAKARKVLITKEEFESKYGPLQ
jgi:S-DNA-T family DNA segregation ATPase FtsK/SpoIIIE